MKEEIFSDDKQLKAIITYKSDGLYFVEFYRWTNEIVSEFGFESDYFWEPILRPSITDTLENAKKLALEQLKEM